MQALLFVADGDMRQAINSLQATHNAFSHASAIEIDTDGSSGIISGAKLLKAEDVFRVCDQPHPEVIRRMIVDGCMQGNLRVALEGLEFLCSRGYAPQDLIGTVFRVVRGMSRDSDGLPESLQLEFMRHIGMTHVRILEGLANRLQLAALLGKLTGLCLEEPTRSLLSRPPPPERCSLVQSFMD